MKRKKWEKFLLIREEICRKRQKKSPGELWSYEIGRRREQKAADVLQEMKDKGLIRGFLSTGDLSFQNIVEGIDFFVVIVDGAYKFYPLSVTGEWWVEEHKHKHPEIPVVSITESDTAASVKNKIMEMINHR